MLINMRNGLMAGKRLPYDAEVEYLARNGTAYIDTMYVPNQDSAIYASFRCLSGSCPIMGVGYISSDFVIEFTQDWICSDFGLPSGSEYAYTNYRATTRNNAPLNVDLEMYSSKNTRWISRNESVLARNDILFPVQATAQNRIYLFAVNGRSITSSFLRIYSAYITESGVRVRDFIPVRFTNEQGVSEGAMYDRANPTIGMNPDGSARDDGLYRNRGTGSFIIGPDI